MKHENPTCIVPFDLIHLRIIPFSIRPKHSRVFPSAAEQRWSRQSQSGISSESAPNINREFRGKTPYEQSNVAKFLITKHLFLRNLINIQSRNFQIREEKSRVKFRKKNQEKNPELSPRIRRLAEEIRRRSTGFTAFFPRTGAERVPVPRSPTSVTCCLVSFVGAPRCQTRRNPRRITVDSPRFPANQAQSGTRSRGILIWKRNTVASENLRDSGEGDGMSNFFSMAS